MIHRFGFLALLLICALNTSCSNFSAAPVDVPENWRQTVAKKAMLAALSGDKDGLKELENLARACQDAEVDSTGRNIIDQIAALETVIGSDVDLKEISLDDAAQWHIESFNTRNTVFLIEKMRKEDRYNRLAQTFNFSTEAASALARLSPSGILRTAIDMVFLPSRLLETTTQQRRALDLLTRLRNEALVEPQSQDPPEIALHRAKQRMALAELRDYEQKINEKIMQTESRDAVAGARWLMKSGNNSAARNLLQSAMQKTKRDENIRKLLIEVSARISAENRLRAATLSPPDLVHPDTDARLLRVVMAEGKHRQAGLLAVHLAKEGPPQLQDDAALVVAIGAKDVLDHKLRKMLETSNGNAARHYRLLIQRGVGSSRLALDNARRETRQAGLVYIISGLRPLKEMPKARTARERAYAVTSAAGLLWPVQWILRGTISHLRPVVPDESWRDAAAAILLRAKSHHRLNAEQKQLAKELAESYRMRKRFDDARWYYEIAELTDNEKLESQHAKHLLKAARATEDLRSKAIQLEQLINVYPDSGAAEKAKSELETMRLQFGRPIENLAVNLPRALIRRQWQYFKEMHIPGLSPELTDGDESNGELKEEGITLFHTQPALLRYEYITSDGSTRELRHELTRNALAFFENGLDVIAAQMRSRHRAEALYDRLTVPFELRASAGPGGFDAQPRLQTIQLPPEQVRLYE